MSDSRSLTTTPVARNLSDISGGYDLLFSKVGLTPAVLGERLRELNAALTNPATYHRRLAAIQRLDITMFPDANGPVVQQTATLRAEYVISLQLNPQRDPPTVRLTVSQPSRDYHGYCWTVTQLQDLLRMVYPSKFAELRTIIHYVNGKREFPAFAEVNQELIDRLAEPGILTLFEVQTEKLGAHVMKLDIERPDNGLPPRPKAYCRLIDFSFEGPGVEVELILSLLTKLFENIPNPFNNDRPFGALFEKVEVAV